MAIQSPQAITFANEVIRPLSEECRALKARVLDAQTQWFGGMNALFPNTAEVLEDGRTAEGVSVLTGADVNGAMGQFISQIVPLNDEIIRKPCVRPLNAE